jgi:hypothetical protein
MNLAPTLIPTLLLAAVDSHAAAVSAMVTDVSGTPVPDAVVYVMPISGKPASPVVSDRPGPVAPGCNIHDRMVGFVYVVQSPWFAKTARTGATRLDLPDGEYDLKVWHPWLRTELPAQRVKVSSVDAQAHFKVDLNPPPKAAPH